MQRVIIEKLRLLHFCNRRNFLFGELIKYMFFCFIFEIKKI